MSDKEIVKCHECLREINLLDENADRIDTEIGLTWYFCKDENCGKKKG